MGVDNFIVAGHLRRKATEGGRIVPTVESLETRQDTVGDAATTDESKERKPHVLHTAEISSTIYP